MKTEESNNMPPIQGEAPDSESRDMPAGKPYTEAGHRQLTRWEQWKGVVFFALLVVGSSALMWLLPDSFHGMRIRLVVILLACGFFFDGLSAFYAVLSFVKRRHMSGFPLVGFIFYVWGWLSYPDSVLLTASDGVVSLWLCKLVDLLALALVHCLFQCRLGPPSRSPSP